MEDRDARQNRLRWRCRRGTRELDELLSAFCETELKRLAPPELDAFAQLLDLGNAELYGCLIGNSDPDDGSLCALIEKIRTGRPGGARRGAR